MLSRFHYLRRCTMALLVGMSAVGCQRWRLDSQAIAQSVPERRLLEIWTGSRNLVVHGVRAQGDSVRAVPYWRPPHCDSCAIYFRRSAIDSIRVQKPDNLQTGLAIGSITVLTMLLLMLAQAMSSMQT